MGQKADSQDPSLYKEVLGMGLYHHTTVLKSPYGHRSCPPSASQDSAGPSTLPHRLSSSFQLHGQSLTSTCPCCLAIDLHCHFTANQLVTSLTVATEHWMEDSLFGNHSVQTYAPRRLALSTSLMLAEFHVSGFDGMRLCSSLLSFPWFQTPVLISLILHLFLPSLSTSLYSASEAGAYKMKAIFSETMVQM